VPAEHVPSEPEPGPLQQVEVIFHAVLAAPEDTRAEILANSCQGDGELQTEVQSLLEAHRAEEALAGRRSDGSDLETGSEIPQRWIGPYQLDRLLGRGGMGAVYLAHRSDGQFQQQVAIKLIDLPLTTDLFRERFRQERQILAGLVHPFIARLLDGGVTEDGDLYLAMEYVDGLPIERYCRENRLPIRDRLLLFKKVCAAVHFAHQNLVVHRDLKSDNILVQHDGTPKLLDFGTAKLLAPLPSASAPTEFTRLGLQSFTPSYASPEQVLGETITTASDTYSLGVLLYLLLAEVPPYKLKEGTTAEMLRLICTEPPPKPSVAAPSPVRPDTDLDAIILKALRKEPQDRYRSVDEFAMDLQAYLDGRPVQARHGTLRYRATKFMRRNTLALGAIALVFASLVAGLAGALWQFRVATLERRRAEASSQDMRQLSSSLLSEIDEAVKQLPGSTPVRRLLVERVLEHLDHMSRNVARDRLTQLELVEAYTRLGNLQGNPYDQNIGDPEGALSSLEKALVLAKALNLDNPGNPGLLGALALAEQSRSEILFGLGRTQESIVSMRAAVDAFNARISGPGPSAAQIAEAAAAFGSLGDQLGQNGVASLGDPEGALQMYRKGLESSLWALQVEPGFTRSKRAVAIDHFKIGNILVETDPVKAIDEYHQSLAAWDALTGADKGSATTQRGVAHTYRKLGLALTETRDYKSAIAAFKEARGPLVSLAGADAKDTRAQHDLAVELSDEALTYLDLLDPRLNPHLENREQDAMRAIELLDRSIMVQQHLVTIDPRNPGWVMPQAFDKVLAGTLRQRLHEPILGEQLATSGMGALRAGALADEASIQTLDFAITAALKALPTRLRNTELAIQFAERLVSMTHHRKPNFLLSLAQAYHAAGLMEKSRATAREGLALLPSLRPGAARPRLRILLELEALG
jgi:eukaryotic-like serine/threonine-protein kinase